MIHKREQKRQRLYNADRGVKTKEVGLQSQVNLPLPPRATGQPRAERGLPGEVGRQQSPADSHATFYESSGSENPQRAGWNAGYIVCPPSSQLAASPCTHSPHKPAPRGTCEERLPECSLRVTDKEQNAHPSGHVLSPAQARGQPAFIAAAQDT